MKRLALAAAAALTAAALTPAAALAAPGSGGDVNRSVVTNPSGERQCFDGFGNVTTDSSWVATKSGSVKVTCHFHAGETNWPAGTKINVFTRGDCGVSDANGNLIWLNSRFVVNKNGSASMTCN